MTDEELLLEMYKGQVARSEHYENLRSAVTNVVLTLSSAFVALIAVDQTMSPYDVWWGFALIALGGFGYTASRLHSMRSRRHGKRAAAYRDELDKRQPTARINAVRLTVPDEHTHLHKVWSAAHIGIMAVGALVEVLALVSK
jgi:hypothetical protein